ncbi:hypothetical protein [Lysobacter capsici]|uniref:hypothetical protein n=1 Tax=Lysobacter capsici TaxID=435897 RepID=UPI001C003EF6|nr:hypothetical protein [Lysobacter capsici]MBW8808760.1 hypothetical protein [Lysobacter sp.]QWF19215.1 hypothetical protein KME82_10975 [Lysobacter capsici]
MSRTLPIAAALLALPHLLAVAASRNDAAVRADGACSARAQQHVTAFERCRCVDVGRDGARGAGLAVRYYSQR